MQQTNVRAELPQETEDQVIQHIKEIKGLLPFLVDLPAKQRRRMAKYSRRREDFLERGLMHARSNPGYLPPGISVEVFDKDVEVHKGLRRIMAELNALYDKRRNTQMLYDAQAFANARIFYKAVKASADEGGEGAETIARDLAYHYNQKKTSIEEEEGGTNPEEPAPDIG